MPGTRTDILPPCLPEFGKVKRGWNRDHGRVVTTIKPGEYYVTREREIIATVLGSCVAACIRDKVTGVGGMNHFMLPATSEQRLRETPEAIIGNSARYGNYAMEHLINTILQQGGRRSSLEVKVFGGGRIISSMTGIGRNNVHFVLDYIATEGLQLLASDVGGDYSRKVQYFPWNGKVRMKKLKKLHNDRLVRRELRYRSEIDAAPVLGQVELF